MKTLKQSFVILLCLSLSFQAISQTNTQTDPESDIPNAFLRVGVQLPTTRSINGRSYKLDLSYERRLSPRLTASATITSGFAFGRSFTPDVFRQSGNSFTYHDILLGLDLDLKYYLSKDKFSGHYLSLVVKDVAAYTRYSVDLFRNASTDGRNIESLPRIGIYYGYRKQFDSGWFLDGRMGYVPNGQSNGIGSIDDSNFDFKLGFGYTIPLGNKRKRK